VKEIIQQYIASVKNHSPKLTGEALNYWADGLSISKLNPKDFYIRAETLQKQMGYVHSGLLRSFYIDGGGNEVTVNFIGENNYATYCTSLDNPKPSKYYFQCIEPSIIINISYEHTYDCCGKYPDFERYIRIVTEDIHRDMLSRMEGFLFDDAENRYLNFVANNPNLYNRISLSDLCTYLGMERQTLTRIRRKIAQRPF
jgi:CRP/FNR family transcriptional regulator, anaerobic regulatory protein